MLLCHGNLLLDFRTNCEGLFVFHIHGTALAATGVAAILSLFMAVDAVVEQVMGIEPT
jgi:hypothetical protein